MDENRLQYLVGRYADNEATETELNELFDHIRQSGEDAGLKTVIMKVFEAYDETVAADHVEWTAMFDRIVIKEAIPTVHRVHFLRKYWGCSGTYFIGGLRAVSFQ